MGTDHTRQRHPRRRPPHHARRPAPPVPQRAPLRADDVTISAAIVDHQPDAQYAEGIAALAEVITLHMLDAAVGEALHLAYTIVQQHQQQHRRRAHVAAATEALRAHLTRLDESVDDA